MKKSSIFYVFIVLFILSSFMMQAAELDETLEDLSGAAAESYVGPIVSAFGSNLNGGWFHATPKSKLFGINVELGFVFMGSFFPKDDEFFETEGSFNFTEFQANALVDNVEFGDFPQVVADSLRNALVNQLVNQEFTVGISGPTIIGPKDDDIIIDFVEETFSVNVQGFQLDVPVPGQSIPLPVGGLMEDFDMFPLGAPQLSIGTIYGTKAVFRYVPPMEVMGVGEFNYFGFGIQHNPKAWLKVPIPIDFCASYFTQTMALGDYVTANATAFGFNASKTLGFSFLSITPYAGYMYEMSNMEFKYTYEIGEVNGIPVDPLDVKFDIDGKNSSRITLGTTLRLGVFNINADYNIAKYNSFTAGFAIGF